MMRAACLRTLVMVPIVAWGMLAAAGCGAPASSEERRVTLEPATVEHAVLPSTVRMTPAIDLDRDDVADSVELELARGEREGAQLVVWAAAGSPRVVIDVAGALRSDAGDSIAPTYVRTYIEHAMRVEHGSPAGRSGTYVDPLIPAEGRDVVITDTERLLAWVDVEAPLGAKPGTYEGELLVRRAAEDGTTIGGVGDALARIAVRAKVHAVQLPARPTLSSSVGLDQSQLVRFEGVEQGSSKLRDVTEAYVGELAAARLSSADLGAIPPGTLPGHRGLDGDGDYLERVVEQRGVASVRIPFYLTYPFEDPLGRDRSAAVRYLRSAAAWARRNGWLDRAYVFAFDEPDDADAGAVRELHELLREADPALRHLVVREASARVFRGSVDIWAPNINPRRYRRADVAREARAGRETWWYPSITTWQPWPTLFIDELRPTPRALGWLAWREGVHGFLYWSATHWHEVEDPFSDPATYNETDVAGNGDGVLIYPGGAIGLAGTPIPSVRLLQLRDGIEDHDLLVMATCAARTAGQRSRIRVAAQRVAPAMDRVDPTSAQVNFLRSMLFDVLDGRPAPARCGAGGA